jgi:hypothetical protein
MIDQGRIEYSQDIDHQVPLQRIRLLGLGFWSHELPRLCLVETVTVRRKSAALQMCLQFRCEDLSLKVQDIWFNLGNSIVDYLVAGSESLQEGCVVYVLENSNLFLSQCVDELGHAKSQIREFNEWCTVSIVLSARVNYISYVKSGVTTNCLFLVFGVN